MPGGVFGTEKGLHKQGTDDEDEGTMLIVATSDSSDDLTRCLQMMFLIHRVLTGMNSAIRNSELCKNLTRKMREHGRNKSRRTTWVPAVLSLHESQPLKPQNPR